MAEHRQQEQQMQRPGGEARGILPEKGPSKQQILAVVAGVPVGGFFLILSGLTLAGTLIGLALTTPLFVICSPVLVPAALTIALAVAGFLTSGAFGITALSSLSWIINYLRRSGRMVPEQLEQAKRRVQETTAQIGQKGREAGQKGQETLPNMYACNCKHGHCEISVLFQQMESLWFGLHSFDVFKRPFG